MANKSIKTVNIPIKGINKLRYTLFPYNKMDNQIKKKFIIA